MFCGECGTQNPDTNQFCKNCGKPIKRPQQAQAPQPAATPLPPAGMQQPGVAAGAVAPEPSPVSRGMWVLSVFLGLGSLITGVGGFIFYPYILGALAVISGGSSIYIIRKKFGFTAVVALFGIVLGLAAIIIDSFYFQIFPTEEFTITLLAILF